MKKLFCCFMALGVVACSGGRRLPSPAPFFIDEGTILPDLRVNFEGLAFVDARGEKRIAQPEAFALATSGSSVKLNLRAQGADGAGGNSAQWRLPGWVRSNSEFTLQGAVAFEKLPKCREWLVHFEVNVGGARRAVGFGADGMRTLTETGREIVAPLDLASIPVRHGFRMEAKGRGLVLKQDDREVYRSDSAGLAAPPTGDVTVQAYMGSAPDCDDTELVVQLDKLRLTAE